MKRYMPIVIAAAVMLLAVCSCGSTWYRIGPVTMTMPLYDNAASSCSVAPVLLGPVPGSTLGTAYLEIVQGSWARLDSIAAVPGQLVTFPAVYVPLPDACTVRGWARRILAGCDTTLTRMPTPTLVAPARPVISAP